MVKKALVIELKNNRKIVTPLLALSFILATIMGTTILLPFQALNAQNVTGQVEDATQDVTGQTENATATTEDANATATTEDEVSITVLQTLAQPGFSNVLEVIDREGNTVPISYNIVGGTAFAGVGDPSRHAIYILVDPGIDGGALEIDLPRSVLDSKASDGTDSRFVVAIDGQQISGEPTGVCIELGVQLGDCPNLEGTFRETETTETDRVLTILFAPEHRVIEIVGNQGTIF
jgi:hypothetical protein